MSSRLAACVAAQKGARVALIAPNWRSNDVAQYTLQVLWGSALTTDLQASWAALCDWVYSQCEHSVLSPAALRAQGIDVIIESTSFERERQLKLKNRHLKASRYLLTDGYALSSANVSGLLPHQLIQLEMLPPRIAVIGRGATALEWAYVLSRRSTVTLILLEQSLLPAADADIQRLAEAQLKSLGIQIIFSHNHCDVDEEQLKSADVDLSVVVPQPYAVEELALKSMGVATAGAAIVVNRYLQTHCPQIYVSGGSLGGENRPELTQQETTVALENALFGRRQIIGYEQAFYSIRLLSSIGCWGLTENQARAYYGHGMDIFQASCLPRLAENVAQTNFCKLLTIGQRIIGVHLMGEGASTLVAAFGQSPCMDTLNRWITIGFEPGTLQDAIYQAVDQWQRSRWSEGQWRRDWAENWFNFRRSL